MDIFYLTGYETRLKELVGDIVEHNVKARLFRPGNEDVFSEDIPEEHRCLCGFRRAIDLLEEGRLAAVTTEDLFMVLRHVVPLTIVAYYNTAQFGAFFVLRK